MAEKRHRFIDILEDYDIKLAKELSHNYLAIYADSKLYEKTNNLSDIVCYNDDEHIPYSIGMLITRISLSISHRLSNNLREVKEGVALINNKGIYFFIMKPSEVMIINIYGTQVPETYFIADYYFFPFDQFAEIGATIKKRIYYKKRFMIRDILSDVPIEDYYSHVATSTKNEWVSSPHSRNIVSSIWKALCNMNEVYKLLVIMLILFLVVFLQIISSN